MEPLCVDIIALHALAGECRTWSSAMSAAAARPIDVPSDTGLDTVEAGIRAASRVLAGRLLQTAAALDEAAARYQATEADSVISLDGAGIR